MPRGSVIVSPGRRGGWEVTDLAEHVRIACATLEEARRHALSRAALAKQCDLVIHDAYNRVVEHQLVGLGASEPRR